jgi:hypothetical protein
LDHLIVDLDPREDKDQNIFYLGKLKFPGNINCKSGVTFLIFLGEDGDEQIQIATIDKNKTLSQYTKKADRINIALESRIDQYKKTFYICRLKFDGSIDCANGIDFLIFTAKEGQEELQIVLKQRRK